MIDKMNMHYAFTNPASIHDEEALTALELAGRTAKKTNEVVEDQNKLRTETEDHLAKQDKDIADKFNEQDKTIANKFNEQDKAIENIRTVTVPADVKAECQRLIVSGEFEQAIDLYLNNLNERVDNLLGSMSEGSTTMDAEVIDGRTDLNGEAHSNIGDAIRSVDTLNHNNNIILAELLNNNDINPLTIDEENALENVSVVTGVYIVKGHTNYPNSGDEEPNSNAKATGFMSLIQYPELFITGQAQYSTCVIALYDEDKNFVASFGHNDAEDESVEEFANVVTLTQHKFTLLDALKLNAKARYIRVSSYNSPLIVERPVKKDINTLYTELKYTYDTEQTNVNEDYGVQTGYYINKVSPNIGKPVAHESGYYTDYIGVNGMAEMWVSGMSWYGTTLVAYFDTNKACIGFEGEPAYSEDKTFYTDFYLSEPSILEKHPTCVYIRLCSFQQPLTIKGYKRYDLAGIVKELKTKTSLTPDNTGNILYGKKLVTCGDSFTEGDFTGYVDENGLSYTNSPVIYDKALGMYKTYPWWIAKRNNMTLVNEAKCGSIMALDKTHVADPNNVDINTRQPFSYERYKNLPKDADYILIQFGLNDMFQCNLGTINDTTNISFYGAFNVVLKYLIQNHPYAKIGTIITNAYLSEEYQNAIKEVSVKWGIPYLDLMSDTGISTTLGKKGACDEAVTIRNNQFRVSSSNNHPNIKAHELSSSYVEAFLRRM